MNENLRSVIVFQFETDNEHDRLTDFHYCAPISLDAACPIEHAQLIELQNKDFDLSPMKPRKTRKESTVLTGSSTTAIRGQREAKEFIVETINDFPLAESSYAAAVKGGTAKSESAAESSSGDSSNGDRNEPLPSAVPYLYGNAAVETVRGIIHLYKTEYGFDISLGGPSKMLLMIHVPVDMSSHELIRFIGHYEEKLETIKIIRDQSMDQYMVLVQFKDQEDADRFYASINGQQFNSLLEERCQLAYVGKVEVLHSSEGAGMPLPQLTELPSCAVCLERMDESVKSVLTVLCNHSFHSQCLKKWDDVTCPVCRYTQVPSAEQSHENKCQSCGSKEDLWICLVCGNVGCGRYTKEHAQHHYLETTHNFAMALNDNRVWDYAGDYFVHRLVTNESSGKMVETKNEEKKAKGEEFELSIQMECLQLLTSQLEEQRKYWEDKLNKQTHKEQQLQAQNKDLAKKVDSLTTQFCTKSDFDKEKHNFDRKLRHATERAVKTQIELDAEREMTKNLMKTRVELDQKVDQQTKEIGDLNGTIRDLMIHIDATQSIGTDNEMQQGSISIGQGKERTRRKRK